MITGAGMKTGTETGIEIGTETGKATGITKITANRGNN